jgi:hypothetical protein
MFPNPNDRSGGALRDFASRDFLRMPADNFGENAARKRFTYALAQIIKSRKALIGQCRSD